MEVRLSSSSNINGSELHMGAEVLGSSEEGYVVSPQNNHMVYTHKISHGFQRREGWSMKFLKSTHECRSSLWIPPLRITEVQRRSSVNSKGS